MKVKNDLARQEIIDARKLVTKADEDSFARLEGQIRKPKSGESQWGGAGEERVAYDEYRGWNSGTYGEQPGLDDGGGVVAGGRGILCVVVLVVAGVAGVSCEHDRRSSLAVDRGGAVGAGICGGIAVRVGLRAHGTRDAGADCSAEAAGRSGFLPLRA